jgi:hypothetical protein
MYNVCRSVEAVLVHLVASRIHDGHTDDDDGNAAAAAAAAAAADNDDVRAYRWTNTPSVKRQKPDAGITSNFW